MNTCLLYFFILIFFLLVLLSVNFTRKLIEFIGFEKLLGFCSIYILTVVGINGTSLDVVAFDMSWKELTPILIIISLIFMIVETLINSYRSLKNKPIKDLQSKFSLLREEYYKLCSDNLRVIFKNFINNPNTRVSMYKFEDNHFKLIGRYSTSPKYNKKGRLEYPCKEGFISKGWYDGECVEFGITPFRRDGKEYVEKVQEKCNIKKNTLKRIEMKSCSFYIKRIENEDSRQPLGIIVTEQLNQNIIDKIAIDRMIYDNIEILTTIYKSMKSLHN